MNPIQYMTIESPAYPSTADQRSALISADKLPSVSLELLLFSFDKLVKKNSKFPKRTLPYHPMRRFEVSTAPLVDLNEELNLSSRRIYEYTPMSNLQHSFILKDTAFPLKNVLGIPETTMAAVGILMGNLIFEILDARQNNLKAEYNAQTNKITIVGTMNMPIPDLYNILYAPLVCKRYHSCYPRIEEDRDAAGNLKISFSQTEPLLVNGSYSFPPSQALKKKDITGGLERVASLFPNATPQQLGQFGFQCVAHPTVSMKSQSHLNLRANNARGWPD